MPTDFDMLAAELPALRTATLSADANGFFVQEVLRFYSVAGTLLNVPEFTLDATAMPDERCITHVLTRSLLENYFTILYLFDDPTQTATRYEQLKYGFMDSYRKLMTDLSAPSWQNFMQAHQGQLEAADPAWIKKPGLPDVNTMLTALRNNYGDRLNYLYPIYRITSFDTHGRSLGTIFESVFGKKCNFPVLNLKYAFELVANQYLVVLNDLRSKGVVK